MRRRSLAILLVLSAGFLMAPGGYPPGLGGGGGGGGGSGDLTAVQSSDGSIDIANGTGPIPDITLPAEVMRSDTNTVLNGAVQITFTGTAAYLGFDPQGDGDANEWRVRTTAVDPTGIRTVWFPTDPGGSNSYFAIVDNATPTSGTIPVGDGDGRMTMTAVQTAIAGQVVSASAASGSKQGDGTKFQMFGSGTPATDDCAKFDAAGNIVSNGAACSSAVNGRMAASASNPSTSPAGFADCKLNTTNGIYTCINESGTVRQMLAVNPSAAPSDGNVLTYVAASNTVAGTTVNNDHGNLNAGSLTDDDHTQYALANTTDLGNVNPNVTEPCASGEVGRKIIRTQGGVLWMCRVSGAAATAKWEPINEQLLGQSYANADSDSGCVAWWGGGFTNICSGTNPNTVLVPGRAGVITRITVTDIHTTDQGSSCTANVFKNPCSGSGLCASNDGDPNDLVDSTDGVLLAEVPWPNSAGNRVAAVGSADVSSGDLSDWTVTATDTIGVDMDTANCTTANINGTIRINWVPFE